MRLKLLFKCEKLKILYRHRFMSLIKEAISLCDKSFKDHLYPDKNLNLEIVKPFSFSLIMPVSKTVKKEKISIDDSFEIYDNVFYFPENSYLAMYISSSDYEFIMNLYNGLLKLKNFSLYEDVNIQLVKILLVNEKKINSDEVVFKTLSPILIEDKDNKPILVDTVTKGEENLSYLKVLSKDDFNIHFNTIHSGILKNLRGYGVMSNLEFQPINLKKQVVKHTLKGFRETTGKPYMTLTTMQGTFKLKGAREDLQMLYQIGIGLRTGQGFGMVEVV